VACYRRRSVVNHPRQEQKQRKHAIVYLTTRSPLDYTAISGELTDEFEGIILMLSRYLFGGTEESHTKPIRIVGIPGEIFPEYETRVLPL
jgi:hypothetical protein